MPVAFLSLAEVLEIHQDQIARYGGDPGTRDLNLLRSALGMPSASLGGVFLHGDIFEKAAAYLYHLSQNHPFVDGNKRTAAAAALVFLEVNGYESNAPRGILSKFVLALARGEHTKADAALFFRQYARQV